MDDPIYRNDSTKYSLLDKKIEVQASFQVIDFLKIENKSSA